MLRFAGFELDQRRAELRGADGAAIRLRPKPFLMLHTLAASAGRVVSKQELMDAVWPNVHVGEDSLFQCIREIRAALADDERRLIKVVSGRGYLFDADVTGEPGALEGPEAARRSFQFFRRGAGMAAGAAALVGIAIAAAILAPAFAPKPVPPAIAVEPVSVRGEDAQGAAMAAGASERLVSGLSGIEGIRVIDAAAGNGPTSRAGPGARDFTLLGELERDGASWVLNARIVKAGSREVVAVASVAVDGTGLGEQIQQSRLAAGVGNPLARSLNALLQAPPPPAAGGAGAGNATVAIEQAMASISHTSRERFDAAVEMLERALASDPGNVDVQVALAGLHTRAIQMLWRSADENAKAEVEVRELLDGAAKARPRSIAVLEATCRFLTATNSFVESAVACARVLNFDPWNGSALYQLGLTQLHMGRFEDALATFLQAYRYDTPAVSRWTWLLGIGWASLMLDRNEEAAAWIEKSIAVTPASGRSHMLLAVAYQRLGMHEKAQAAMGKALELRPGSTVLNVASPTRNASPDFVRAAERQLASMVEAGLPEN